MRGRRGVELATEVTRADQNRFIGCPVRFQANRLKNFLPSDLHREHQIVYVKAELVRTRSSGDERWYLPCQRLLALSGVPFFDAQLHSSAIEAQPLGGCQVTSGLVVNSLAIPAEQLRR